MPKSMTAYARCELIEENQKISMEIKSVNHRYSDINIKMPRIYLFLEEKIRKYIGDTISRGKIDVFMTVDGYGDQKNLVMVNEALAESYINALKSLADKFGIENDIAVSSVARYTDIFRVERSEVDEEEIWLKIQSVLEQLMERFVEMRKSEGDRLKIDVLSRTDLILEVVDLIEKQNPETVRAYQGKLKDKIAELTDNAQFDETRLLTEVALFADKIAVAEEITRLRSHIDELRKLMQLEEPIGRKLDFIVQEMNREINTIGSKCNDIEIAKKVVDVKSEIEKIREQIQNIE